MLLTFKIKLNTTIDQSNLLEQVSNSCRLLYNNLLEQKIKYYEEHKKHLSYYTQQKELKNIKDDFMMFDSKKEVLRGLESNYKSFFALIKKNKTQNPGTPKFRGKHYFFTLSYIQDFIIKDKHIEISLPNKNKLKLKLKYDFPINGLKSKRNKSNNDIKQLKIYKKNNNYYASITYEKPVETSTNHSKDVISIDLGKMNLVAYYNPKENNGVIYNSNFLSKNQKFLDKRVDELKSIRDKKTKGSRKWNQINTKIKNVNQKKRTQTNLTLQRLSKDLSKLNTDIVIGELTNLKQHIKSDFNHKKNRQMQNNWNLTTFVRLLEYKTQLKGNQVIKVNEAWTSKTCCKCGSINYDQTTQDRTYICECGNTLNRDLNGAINIYKVYLGDYNTPIDVDNLSSSKRFSWCNIKKMNEKIEINY